MALWIYRLGFLPVMLVLAPYYLWRMRRRGGYVKGFGHRFGRVPKTLPAKSGGRRRIWLQAVSVGELLAIGPLVDALLSEEGNEIYLTTTTSTGYALAKERYEARVAAVAYFPIDFWACSALAWKQVQPDLVVLTEGERWPEHIYQALCYRVPVVGINARMSDRSYRRMKLLGGLVPGLMGSMERLLVVSDEDARRFRELGFTPGQVEVTGNLKVDNVIPELEEEAKVALRAELGFSETDVVMLGSSIWPGEEVAMMAAWRRARAEVDLGGRALRLLLVPRHAERRLEVEALVRATGADYHLRSSGNATEAREITIADTTGELQRLTQVADIVFVGKSLPPHSEGQTPVEAAGLGRPLLFGPRMGSFRAIARDLLDRGAAQQVQMAEDLGGQMVALLGDEPRRNRLGEAGRAWHKANRGALERTIKVLRKYLNY
ncbi:MAG: 3-deoxy-D-manno-octulosonic acid transferase [Candidatus Synoicihabitans palmerolidicus]|nr:3-deoxy-D-manno-octulosonic acid transferase [Candidatus Synoicihabitans palmerolidicus]